MRRGVEKVIFMNRLVSLAAAILAAMLTATPAVAQGRFGHEAQERAADRIERESIRRAEHPELHQVAGKLAETPAQNVTMDQPVPEPAPNAAPVTSPSQ